VAFREYRVGSTLLVGSLCCSGHSWLFLFGRTSFFVDASLLSMVDCRQNARWKRRNLHNLRLIYWRQSVFNQLLVFPFPGPLSRCWSIIFERSFTVLCLNQNRDQRVAVVGVSFVDNDASTLSVGGTTLGHPNVSIISVLLAELHRELSFPDRVVFA
jgi:hypothetical protein